MTDPPAHQQLEATVMWLGMLVAKQACPPSPRWKLLQDAEWFSGIVPGSSADKFGLRRWESGEAPPELRQQAADLVELELRQPKCRVQVRGYSSSFGLLLAAA